MKMLPTPFLRSVGSRFDHMMRIGRFFSRSKFIVSSARSAGGRIRVEMVIVKLRWWSCNYKKIKRRKHTVFVARKVDVRVTERPLSDDVAADADAGDGAELLKHVVDVGLSDLLLQVAHIERAHVRRVRDHGRYRRHHRRRLLRRGVRGCNGGGSGGGSILGSYHIHRLH